MNPPLDKSPLKLIATQTALSYQLSNKGKMSAISQLTKVTEMIAEATAMIQKMQECLPSLVAAAAAETTAPQPKLKKAKKVKASPPVEPVSAPVAEAVSQEKQKKPASDGTMAWHAFVKHVQETQPSRFVDFKKHSEMLHEAKSIRQEDEDGYKSFVSSWKAARLSEPAPVSTVEEIVVSVVPAMAAPMAAPIKEEVKEKRKPAVGTMAWHAFVSHCKATMPELASISNAEKLQNIKARKESDKAGYETFVNIWKAAQPVA